MKADRKSKSNKKKILFSVISCSAAVLFVSVYLCMGNSKSSSMSVPTALPKAKHTATVIFLHGLGDTGHGWLSLLSELKTPHIKFMCPTAPTQPVSLNAGMSMPSWFDIKGLSPAAPEDIQGIQNSSQLLQKIAEEESRISNIPASRIMLGGFSQGGAVAIHSALTSKKKFAGLLLLSCWLPQRNLFENPADFSEFRDTPVFQGHGQMDPMVAHKWGEATSDAIRKLSSAEVLFKSYPNMGHASSDQEMRDIQAFIDKYLPADPK